MNRSFIVAVLTVTMIIMMSTAGYAIAPPHSLACDNCHGKFLGGDRVVSATNSCITCHSSQAEATRMPVNPDAMANPFGTTPGQPATGPKSSHNWASTTPYAPAAMVVEAVGMPTGFSNVPLTGTVTCIRCHNAKDNLNTTNKPFLRAVNTNDSLCLNCHAPRNVTSHTTGSHPVGYRIYSTVYKSNTTAFRKSPLSPNAYNPTANLGNYLKGGKIVCTTCHAPHYADSSSATLDNRSTANGFAVDDPAKGLKGQQQNSKGQLLRTDPIGATASSINVCSACHKETKNLNHNAKGQNVQCDHCHAAHVDYTGDGSLPNLYLVRRDFSNISISTGKLSAGKKAIYNTSTSLRFMRNDGKGICQVCHTPTPGVAIHDQLDTRKEDCLACHKHSNGFTAAACDACHGQPPVQGKAAAGYTLDEAFTPHATHADAAYYKYSCKNCHYDGTRADSHNTLATTGTATFQSVFVDTAGSVGALAGYANVPANYDTTAKTCSVVYCHSNGKPRGGAISWKSATTPSWANGKNKILNTPTECITCHESGSTLNTNAHYKHVTTNAIKCYVCHYATVSDASSIKDRTKHANGTKDVVFVNQPANFVGGAFDASFNDVDATCTNSCHTNGLGGNPVTTAKWTDSATGACGQCHPAVPVSNLHTFHFTDPMGPQLGTAPATTVCVNCHIYAAGSTTHANGIADLKASPCAPCHPGASPTWNAAAIVTCESCHTGTASVVGAFTAPLKSLNNTVGHGQYSSATLNVKCTSCHNASAPHIGAGAGGEKRLSVAGNALCNTCHIPSIMKGMSTARANMLTHSVSINGNVNVFTHYTTTNDYRARDCAGCHDTHGTTNYLSVRTVIAGQTIRPVTLATLSTALRVTTPNGNGIYNGLCQVCHTKVKYFKRNAAPDTSHNGGKNCLSCHTHKGGQFAFAPGNGTCGGCHGYPPVANMTGFGTLNNYTNAKIQTNAGVGGAHSVAGHIPKNAKESQAWTNCTNCHYNTNHTMNMPVNPGQVNVIVDPQFKFDGAAPITYNASTCSNVSCHFKPSPNWTTGL